MSEPLCIHCHQPIREDQKMKAICAPSTEKDDRVAWKHADLLDCRESPDQYIDEATVIAETERRRNR